MKKKCLIFILALSSYLFCQGGWQILEPIDSSHNVWDLHFFSPDSGWILSNTTIDPFTHLLLAFTVNGGDSWDTTTIFPSAAQSFDFYDTKLSMLILGSIRRTEDGWKTWTKPFVDTIGLASKIKFGSRTHAYAVGLQTIIKTTDSGFTWEYVQPDSLLRERFLGLSVLDSITLYTISSHQLLFTSDGGKNWKFIPLPEEVRFTDVNFVNKNYGWITGTYMRIYLTTDGGETWIKQTPFPYNSDAFYSIDALDTLNAVTVSNGGSIYWTSDGGKHWVQQAPSGKYKFLRNVQILSEKVAYAVGDKGTILKTTTGGVTWVNDNSDAISKVFALFQNYPNPFNPVTTIKYTIPTTTVVTLKVYDVLGSEIATLVNEEKPAGTHSVNFSVGSFGAASNLTSGVYFYQLKAGRFVETKKMILLR
jgi:photosystem II stability/assembly factor-like uncharacterized protein